MGAELFFKVPANQADQFNDMIDLRLDREKGYFQNLIDTDRIPYVQDAKEIEWAEQHAPDLVDSLKANQGKGSVKVSGIDVDDGRTEDVLEELVAILKGGFAYDIRFYAGSCAFDPDYYFTHRQIASLTRHGNLLSGKSKNKEDFDRVLKIATTPPCDLKKGDTFQCEGKQFRVAGRKTAVQVDQINNLLHLADLRPKDIKDIQRWVPTINAAGSEVFAERYLLDRDQKIVYLEMAGSEPMVNAVSSLFLTGRWSIGETQTLTEFQTSGVYHKGNRRKMAAHEGGLAVAVVYHLPSIFQDGFSVIMGRDLEEMKAMFGQWLDKSQPLPYPKELEGEIYDALKQHGQLEELQGFGGLFGVQINDEVKEEEWAVMQQVIIEVCSKHGFIDF